MATIEDVSGTAFVVAEYRAEENRDPAPIYRDPVVGVFLSDRTLRERRPHRPASLERLPFRRADVLHLGRQRHLRAARNRRGDDAPAEAARHGIPALVRLSDGGSSRRPRATRASRHWSRASRRCVRRGSPILTTFTAWRGKSAACRRGRHHRRAVPEIPWPCSRLADLPPLLRLHAGIVELSRIRPWVRKT